MSPEYYVSALPGVGRCKWVLEDEERPRDPLACYDCGAPYSAIGDCYVPNTVWAEIQPARGQGAGILCANCIAQRLGVVGRTAVWVKLWPGEGMNAG